MRRVVSHDAVGAEDDLVLVHAELDLVAALRDPPELRERARRDDRLEVRAPCPRAASP